MAPLFLGYSRFYLTIVIFELDLFQMIFFHLIHDFFTSIFVYEMTKVQISIFYQLNLSIILQFIIFVRSHQQMSKHCLFFLVSNYKECCLTFLIQLNNGNSHSFFVQSYELCLKLELACQVSNEVKRILQY